MFVNEIPRLSSFNFFFLILIQFPKLRGMNFIFDRPLIHSNDNPNCSFTVCVDKFLLGLLLHILHRRAFADDWNIFVLCIEIGRLWCHNDVIKLCKFIILHILKNYSMSNFAKNFIYDPFTKIMLTIMIFLYLLLPSVIQRHMFMFVFYQFSTN